MPYYDFLNEKTGEIKSLFLHMDDEKIYIDNDGYKWIRQFSSVNASVDAKIDPFDHKRGLEKLKNTKGSLGDLQDFSGEQSRRREEKLGTIDPVAKKTFDKYKEIRGKDHPEIRKRKVKELTKEVMIKFKSKL